jgi:radical SAM protein with 4Fe4S-binding SPASM domain
MEENSRHCDEINEHHVKTNDPEEAQGSQNLSDDDLLKARIFLPEELFHFPKGDWHLFYDRQNHVWVRVNESGRQLIELFQKNDRIETVVGELCLRLNATPGDILKPVLSFVRHMIDSYFFFVDRYVVKKVVYELNAPHPRTVYFSNTERCNLRCVYCYNMDSREKYGYSSEEMTTQQQLEAIDKLRDFKLEIFAFCGGEPLCRRDVFDVAAHAKNKGFFTALVTNGTLITQAMVPIIVDLFDLVWVSLDSHVKEEHELLRGKGSFEPTMRAIRWLCQTRPKRFIVNSVVCKMNYKSMPEMKKLLVNEMGVDEHRGVAYIPVKPIRDKNNQPLESILDNESLKFMEEEGVEISLGGDELPTLSVDQKDGLLIKQANRRIQCGFASGDICMVSNGDIYPCVMMYKKGFCGGNILKNSLEDIYLHSSAMKACRESTVDTIPECADCVVKYVCAGGCRASAYELYGDLKAHPRDLCPMLKRTAIHSMWLDTQIPLPQVQKAKEIYKRKLESLKAAGKISNQGVPVAGS